MGVKLQFVLGVVLVSFVWGSKDTLGVVPTISATSETVAIEKPEHHINLIEISPKTEIEQKNINNNTYSNLINVKLNQTEERVQLSVQNEDDNEKVESNNVVEKERVSKPNENTINKDLIDKNRNNKSRAIGANLQKYAPSDYYKKHNVYTSPLSIDPEKYIDQIFVAKTTTDKFENDFESFELTTPKSYYFDNKYKAAVDNIDQKLDDDVDDDDDDNDNDADNEENLRMERLNENTTPKSNFMEFKELQGMRNNTFRDKNKVHKDTTITQVKRVNINTSFFDSEIDDDEDDEDSDNKFPRGEKDKLETTSPKNNLVLTTRKSVTFTRLPINKNNSYIISNNVESEAVKSTNFVTTESPTTRNNRNEEERLSHLNEFNRSTTETTEKLQDNQIIPLRTTTSTIIGTKVLTATVEHHLIPTIEEINEETTTYREESYTSTTRVFEDHRTISIEENFTPTISSGEDNRYTSSEQMDEDDITNLEQPTTNIIETTAIHTTDKQTTTDFRGKTDPLIEEILTSSEEPTTLKDIPSTLYSLKPTATEGNNEEITVDSETPLITTDTDGLLSTNHESRERISETSTLTTNKVETLQPETFTAIPTILDPQPTTTIRPDEESTIEIKTKTIEPGFRTSKSVNLARDNENVNPVESTSSDVYKVSFPAVTETIGRSTTTESEPDTTPNGSDTTARPMDFADSTSLIPDTMETIPSDFAQIKINTTTQKPITVIPKETTEEVFSTIIIPRDAKIFPQTTESISTPPIITMQTILPTVNGASDSSTTLPQEISSEKITDVNKKYAPSTVPTTTSFIQISNSDTTTLPEIISPGVTHLPADTDAPTQDIKPSEDSIIITTTEDDTDTAATEGVTGTPDDKKGTIAAIVISTVGAVCLVLLAGLLYIMRKRQKRFNYGERCRPVSLDDYSVDNVSVYNSVRRKSNFRQSKRSYGNPAFDDPTVPSHPLNFPALAKFAKNAEDMKAEFEEIPQIVARTSELPDGCETKNRYANVIPLPETRVCLNPIEGYHNSDYINANYVTGPKNVKGYYIATQAPMQNTVDDFWRMIWEQQSKVILMITHFFENGVEKCVDYLPPSEVLDCHRLFGDFQVTLKKRDVKEKYIISSLQLKNMVSNSWREITHFWYMGWPEKGVPTEGNSLIAFLIEARSYMKSATLDKNAAVNGDMKNSSHNEINPVVVHCSPGTGRTGAVIACDIAIREFEQTRLVDIPKIVYRLRRDRANAVQTREQYMFIYKVVSLYATKLTGGSLDSF